MRSAALTQFLIDVTRGHLRDAFAEDPDGVLSAAPLDERLRRAVREQDIGSLWLAEVHPMALLYFARNCGWDNQRYYACLAQAEIRKGVPVEAERRVERAPSRTHR